jgi:hypothetical protein
MGWLVAIVVLPVFFAIAPTYAVLKIAILLLRLVLVPASPSGER